MTKKVETLETVLMMIELLRRIPRKSKISSIELQAKLSDIGIERNIRTIQRQLEILSERFDIERDDSDRPYGYRWKEHSQGLMLPYLSEHESLLLQLAQQYLSALLPVSTMRSMSGFFEQAHRNLTFEPNSKLAKQWLSKVRLINTTQPLLPPHIHDKVLETISNALYGNYYLEIDYVNAEGKQTHTEVMPLGLVQQGTTLYLVCRFKDYDNERILALHRFNAAKKLDRTFTYPKNFSLQRYDAEGRFGFGDGKKVKLTFKIKKHVGLHIVESPLSNDQTTILDEDYYVITATVVDTMILDKWLRGFGEDILFVTKEAITI